MCVYFVYLRMLWDSVIPLPHIYGARIKGVEVFCPLDSPPPYETVAGSSTSAAAQVHLAITRGGIVSPKLHVFGIVLFSSEAAVSIVVFQFPQTGSQTSGTCSVVVSTAVWRWRPRWMLRLPLEPVLFHSVSFWRGIPHHTGQKTLKGGSRDCV